MRLIGNVAVLAGVANALSLLTPRDAPRVVQHDIRRTQIERPSNDAERLRPRAGTIAASLTNRKTLYLMNTYIGTPAQTFNLHIDTGSSDLWVNTPKSTLCSSRGNQCSVSGTYSANSSSTYSYVNSLFNITYADGSGSTGDYATDTVSFGGANLTGQELGIGYYSSSAEGILGIGYTTNEAILRYNGDKTYVNVPQHLVQSGYINSNAYSLWLNDLDASTGSILFGGVDTDKFQGTLQTVPIIKTSGVYSAFLIALTALGFNGNTGSIASNQAIAVLLDSGSSLMYLPDNLAQQAYTMFGAQYDQEEGLAIIDCSQQQNSTTLDFTFSGATIRVALSEMVIVAGYNGRENVCILGISPADGSTAVLGDTFLRSAYVVYDLENNEISLAQTDFNSTSSNVLEITNTSVPSATAVTSPVTTATNAAGGVGNINGGTITLTSTIGGAAPTPAAYGAAVIGAVGAGLIAML
ncbi:hypothetical protein AMS68_007972 [Peltaster fructicola]|uniref:Probable aspartic-type endopeptidase OPSB n=1 Tax=Peltaster fructicola TaxID=286661 RepID=A0A6H0Y6C7_9PEZI|nr:hypothetical protein AMS68_007972 [Peltaster fructicola]